VLLTSALVDMSFTYRDGQFQRICTSQIYADDVSLGFMINVILHVPLTESFLFYSHLMELKRVENLTEQVK